MKIRAEMGRGRAPLCPREYQVDKVVEVPGEQFAAFLMRPLERRPEVAAVARAMGDMTP